MKILYSSIIVSIRWISHISYLNFFLDNKYTDKMGSKNPYHFRKIILLISILIVVCSGRFTFHSKFSRRFYMIMILMYLIFIPITILSCLVVKGYDIDDDDFCMIRFYKVKHFDDPTPYSHDGNGKRRSYLKEKSIKVIGECCWRVFK